MRKAIESFNRNKEKYIIKLNNKISEAQGTPYIYALQKFSNASEVESFIHLPFEVLALGFKTTGIELETRPLPNIPKFGSEGYRKYLENSYEIDKNFEASFWEVHENRFRFESLLKFNAFEDIIVTVQESIKLKKKGQLFNTTSWLTYLEELIKLFYPEFIQSSGPTRSIKRFEKPVNSSFNLFIEYSEGDFKQNLNKGRMVLPIIYFGFSVASSKVDTIIGELKEPIIGEAAIPLDAYYANEIMSEVEPGVFNFSNGIIAEQIGDDKVRLYNSPEFGLSLIKHLFFYMDVTSFFFSNYVKFWETILNDI